MQCSNDELRYEIFFQATLSKNRAASPPFRAIYLKRCFFDAKIFKHPSQKT